MRRSIVSLFSFLAIALIALTGCQEPQNTIPGSVDSISVRVMDSTDAKTITPEGNVNISHYIITVVNEAEGINQSSGYLTKGSMFTVSNVPAGTWYAKVDAYIDRGEDTYVKVASDQSEPKAVAAGASTTFELVLDTLDAVASGDVTVTLKMPAALSAESTAFWYQYTITGMTDEEFSHTSELLSGSIGADGLATITLDADVIGLVQSAYRFAITVQDAETSPSLTRKGVDVMRLVNGLAAKGTIDLTTYEADQSFDVTITDKIGDILTPALEDGKEVYNLDGQDGNASLTVTLAEPLTANETIEWYVDGELDETVNADEAASGKYTLAFTPGNHTVTAIVRDTGTEMSIGSISFMVKVEDVWIEEEIFTFSINADSQSYTVTGLKKSEGEFIQKNPDIFRIPSTYNGLPVTVIGESAFEGREDITGSLVIPDSIKEIKANAFFDCMNMTGTLDLGASVESIEYRAFQDCAFSGDLVLPESVRYVGEKAFRQFSDRGMFRGGQLVLNEGLEEIGEGAFKSVKFTGTLVIPSTVTKIGGFEKERFNEGNGSYSLGAFEDTAFTELVFTENSQLESLGDATFMGTYIRGGRVEVPATVREIGHMCFSGTGPYEYFSLASASNLEYIGECAFRNVDFGAGSPTIKWPDNMTTVRYEAFESAENISVDLHDGITEIEAYAFRWFSGKVTTEGELRLPAGLIGIGNWNWAVIPDRDEVSYLKLPGNLEVIGASTYIDTNNVYIPASVRIIRDNGFGSNTSEDAIYQTLYFGMDESVSDSWSDQWNKGFSDSHQTMFWNVPEADFDAIMNNDSVPYDVAEPVVGYDSETVTLSCDTSFAHIYYTLDGSEPDKDSTLYTEPFRHIGDFTLKAVAYVGNGIYSDVVTKPLSSVGAGGID